MHICAVRGDGEGAGCHRAGKVAVHGFAVIGQGRHYGVLRGPGGGQEGGGHGGDDPAVYVGLVAVRHLTQGIGGGKAILVDQPFGVEQAQPFDEGAEILIQRHKFYLAVHRADVIIVRDEAKGMTQEFQIEGADKGQRDLVLFAVAVGILIPEGAQHIRQLVNRGGHGQLQRIHPGFIQPHAVLHRLLGDGRQGSDAAVRQGDGVPIFGMRLQDGVQVGAILLQIGL